MSIFSLFAWDFTSRLWIPAYHFFPTPFLFGSDDPASPALQQSVQRATARYTSCCLLRTRSFGPRLFAAHQRVDDGDFAPPIWCQLLQSPLSAPLICCRRVPRFLGSADLRTARLLRRGLHDVLPSICPQAKNDLVDDTNYRTEGVSLFLK